VDDLERIVRDHRVDEIIIAFPPDRRAFLGPVLARGFDRHVRVALLPDLPHVPHAGTLLPERAEIARIGGRTCIGFAPVAKVGWTKRAMDLALACLALVMLSAGLAIIALAIKLDSPGPVLYRQRRVGKDGRHFWMYKFRSMRRDADRMVDSLREMNEASGPLFKMRRDPRVTRVGAILRRLSLDELPQLINVLRGEMSLVGPRPPVPDEVEQYEDWQHGRLRALPGMTGLWQVSGRSELSFVEMVRLDLQYVRNWTLALDVQILWRTVPAVLTRRGAY
jgi:exopolysaccharide biosynthesis polyprenyl glycosylphosphotransferase